MKYKIKNLINNRKTLYLVLSIVLVSVFTLTIAYAALNTILKITGNAEVSAASWNIYLDNVQLISGSATQNKPTITDKTTASFSTTLTNPGDYYMFTIDVVNNGTINAMIDSIEKTPILTESQSKYLNYIVEYQNGENINIKELVEKNSFVRLKVKVEFRKDLTVSDLPTTSETLNLSFTVKYTQAEESGTTSVENAGKLVRVMSGDYDTIGSEICIGEECFYVISSTNETVTMLSKYNLYVGGSYDNTDHVWTAYGDEATGKQDSRMIGYVSEEKIVYGVTEFSNDAQKGINISDYSGSVAEKYVNNYNDYLIKHGITPIEARLITGNELKMLGCDTVGYSCWGELSWIYSTTYWTSEVINNEKVLFVASNSNLYDGTCNANGTAGIRPVITISKS